MTELKLYPDTNLIPWPTFIVTAYKRRKSMAIMFGVIGACLALFISTTAAGIVGWSLAPLVFVLVAGVITVGTAMYADSAATKTVIVYRKDSAGLVIEDHQKWWIEDVMKWPDSHKMFYNGSRVLFIDALGDDPIPLDLWIKPSPSALEGKGKMPVTGTRVASIKAKERSAARVLKYRESDPGEKFQQGLFAGVIVVSLIATLMAADRVAQMYGYVN